VVLGGQDAAIFKPIPDKIRVLRDEIFSAVGPLSPMASGDHAVLMQEDAARLRIVNGTYTEGLPERTGNYLLAQGMQVVEAGGYTDQQYARTTIVLYGPKLYTLRYLITVFRIDAVNQIVFSPDPGSPVDIEIRVGGRCAQYRSITLAIIFPKKRGVGCYGLAQPAHNTHFSPSFPEEAKLL
jgi:hypothetical protein